MLPSQVIDKAEKWIKGSLARTAEDKVCAMDAPDAVKFCAVGALHRAYPHNEPDKSDENLRIRNEFYSELNKLLNVRRPGFSYLDIVTYNNDPGRTHEEMHSLFKEVEGNLLFRGVIKEEEPCVPAS